LIPCERCGRPASESIGLCYKCLKEGHKGRYEEVHKRIRIKLGLPPEPPREGLRCGLCVNECRIPKGGIGYCGIWRNEGRLRGSVKYFQYLDPLPTNCVATPVCPAATSRGYPRYTNVKGPEVGKFNLAVFAYGCTLDCLFCQNWEHKTHLFRVGERSLDDIIREAMREEVSCVCFFGGDPTPQAPFFIKASKEIIAKKKDIIRMCWETNGLESPAIMRSMAELSLRSGGIVKIDWMAWSPKVYEALTGVNGDKALERLKENVNLVWELGRGREPPLLVVSVLLVPLYVTLEEVEGIANYLASIDENIPLVLLGFFPTWYMKDLPPTSKAHAFKAFEVAKKAGLKEVYLGNEHLLGDHVYPF